MAPVRSAVLSSWSCSACGFGWVSGEALAAYLPTVEGFEKLRAAAVAARLSRRSLSCPLCRAQTLHLVQAAGAELDVCMRCAGVALDPGELPALSSMRYTTGERIVNAVGAAEALVQILAIFF
jgi:hypothetical protein